MLMKRALGHVLFAPTDSTSGAGGASDSDGKGGDGKGGDGNKNTGGDDLAAKLKAAEAELAALKKAAADAAAADAAAKKKIEDDKLIADGKTQQLLAQRDAEIAALRPLAEFGRTARATQEKALEDAKAKLSDDDKALVDAAPTFEAKQALVARLAPASTSTSSKGGGPPPPGGTTDFAKAWTDPAAWAEAEKKDPTGAAAWVAAQASGAGQVVSFHRAPKKGA